MSCLFNSLSYFIPNTDQNQLREIITNHLLTNPKLLYDVDTKTVVEWECNLTLENYVSRMKQSYTWGGATEIKAFCEIFNKSVNVILMNGTMIEFIPNTVNEATTNVNITYTGSHYEPVRNTN